ncbi:hypothetical protein [Microlunatus speluncae]|uniref:hypothetical protein n=1 Tax=Microlunatus speluncae TaxID=2594267 RepID=UPI0012665E54|nr:hypothetical protein [Microlunatus speluncae]
MAAVLREVALSVLVLLVVFAFAVGGLAAVWFPLETMISSDDGPDGDLVADSVIMMILGIALVAFAVGLAVAFPADRREKHRIAVTVIALVAAFGIGTAFIVVNFPGGLPDDVYELDRACDGTTYDDATPYAGPAPHPVTVQMPSETGQLLIETPGLPNGSVWPVADPDEPEAVQLIACGSLEGEQRSDELTCGPYSPTGLGSGISVPMVRATYRVRVYELRTHRQIRSVVVEGEDTECPKTTSEPPPDRMLSELTDDQWQTVLADLVNADLP